MERSNAPTLQDVAREAGVSAMTVSAVLNGARSGTRVSAATRVRIEETAARLFYRPNAAARGLSRRRMDTLGVAAAIDGAANLYFLEVLNGILEAAAKHGQNTTIFSVSDWAGDEARILGFCDGRVDGIVLIGPHLTAPFAETLGRRSPFVTLHSAQSLPGTCSLDVDNEAGAFMMVRHLIAQGHRRIAHFTGGEDRPGARQRLAGYRRALAEASLPSDDALVLHGGFTTEVGRRLMADLLDRPGVPPTGVFCANDASAYGALETMAARGLRAPQDVSIGGFDDLMLAQMTMPHLTTIRQPFREMGRRAVELLLPQICPAVGDAPDPSFAQIFDVELVVRGSTGPPRESSDT